MASDTIFTSSSSQQRWVNQMAKTMSTQSTTITIDDNGKSTFSVSVVPEKLISEKPEAYTPKHIGLGPYHHLRPSLYMMEFQKIAAAKKILSSFKQVENFQTARGFIEKMKELEPRVRAFYDRYLDLDSDTLAWIMAVDALFLFDKLCRYSTTTSTLPEEDLVGDMLMLENQIPMFVITEMLTLLADTSNSSDQYSSLNDKVLGFCQGNSPLKLSEFRGADNYSHLLDCMYNLIINNRGVVEDVDQNHKESSRTMSPSGFRVIKEAWKNKRFQPNNVNKVVDAFGGVAALAGISEVNKFSAFIKNLQSDKLASLYPSSPSTEVSKVTDEIKIPSVSHLCAFSKVKFCATHGGIRDMKFDKTELTFHLPVITLNNKGSEVVLRNLVAYEAAVRPNDHLEMAKYVDLMCGIIDTAEDVELLKQSRIVVSTLGNEEIANIFNGMNKMTGGREYETVDEVNRHFHNQLWVRIYQGGKTFIDSSWKMLVSLASIILLLLMTLNSFCNIYGCSNSLSLKMVTSI